jgi:hypothetical protein
MRQLAPDLSQVDVPGAGPISLAPLDRLRDALGEGLASADDMARESAELALAAEDRLADAGALLVPRRAWWRCRPQLEAWLDEAERLAARVELLDGEIERAERERQAVRRGPLATLVDRWRGGLRDLHWARSAAAAELRRVLVLVAGQAGDEAAEAPDVAPLLTEVGEMETRAAALRSALVSASPRLAALSQEVEMRQEAWRRMGFDALYLAASFSLHGPPGVQCAYDAEPGEVVYFAADAVLSRMAGGYRRAGPGVHARHSGIPTWVGTIQTRPAPPKALTPRDQGMLVVSSHRLAFVGRRESLRVALRDVEWLDAYLDGIAVTRRNADKPDFYAVGAPRQVAFYLNWAMSRASVRRAS